MSNFIFMAEMRKKEDVIPVGFRAKGIKNFKLKNKELLAKEPMDLKTISPENRDKEILRLSIIAELDAVSLYEQMAALTNNLSIKNILLDIAKEEKTHVGEFQALLLDLDEEHARELEAGRIEADKMRGED